jgi:uncharacterized protein (DUF1499 family)
MELNKDNSDDFVDWNVLSPPDRPNNWLLAPESDNLVRRGEVAPIFNVGPEILASTWKKVIEEQPRVQILAVSNDGLKVEALQRSAIFGFVDRISSRVIAMPEQRSTLAVYSRSTVGYWDLGVNRRRVQEWVRSLGDLVTGVE